MHGAAEWGAGNALAAGALPGNLGGGLQVAAGVGVGQACVEAQPRWADLTLAQVNRETHARGAQIDRAAAFTALQGALAATLSKPLVAHSYMGQLHIGLQRPGVVVQAVIAFDKKLSGVAEVIGREAFIDVGKTDPALALYRVARIGQAAVKPERVPGVTRMQAELDSDERGFGRAPGVDAALAVSEQQPRARALFESMVGTDHDPGVAVADFRGVAITVESTVLI